MRPLLGPLRREEGGALLFVAIGLPVLLAVFALVIDVGNWYVHKRALQKEVDAAAFAGSQMWGACFKTVAASPAWRPMELEAQNYDGELVNEDGVATKNYNQLAGTQAPGGIHGTLGVAFNSTTFPLDPPPNATADDTPPDPCVLTTGADGKGHYIFDVKATEQTVPLIFGGAFPGLTGPSIHATARTELRQVESLSGLLPIGVSDPSPVWMLAQFVDEDNADNPISPWIQLCKIGRPGCPGTPGSASELWTTPATTAIAFPATSKHVGVRLKYVWGGTDSNPACGTTLADCYDNTPSETQSNGLEHIRLYAAGAAGVHANNVWMLAGTCTDGYFAANDAVDLPCNAGVQAQVDLGNHPLTSAWSSGPCAGGCAQVWATLDGSGQYQLSPPGTYPVSGLATWTLTAGLPLSAAGPHPVGLAWKWKQTAGTWNGNPCTTSKPCQDNGSFNGGNPIQRAFVADNDVRSGPVIGITIWSDTVTGGANSFPQGTTQNLGVTVRNPCFETELADPACPLVSLRVSASATGSESQSLDCDPNLPNIKDEIANGCAPSYILYPNVSGSTPCPTQSTLWSNQNPPAIWDCVAVQTGNGDVEGGLKERIGTDPATCANNWPDYPADDKRQVPLFLVPYSAFGSAGSNKTYPVIGFGAFYITGYKNDPCPNATTSGVKQGTIPGYFITYLPPGKGATPSTKPCDPLGLTPCIPVLIK